MRRGLRPLAKAPEDPARRTLKVFERRRRAENCNSADTTSPSPEFCAEVPLFYYNKMIGIAFISLK